MTGPVAGRPADAPARIPVRWLRVTVGLLGLAAVGLSGGAGPLADLALLAGSGAALASAWLPHTAAPWGVLLAAALPRLSGAAGVTGELLAQSVAVLLFHVLAGLLAVVAAAETVELRALRPGLLRCAAAVAAVLPAGMLGLLLTRPGPAALSGPTSGRAAGLAAVAAAALLLVLGGRSGRSGHSGRR